MTNKTFFVEISPDKFFKTCTDEELNQLSIELEKELRNRLRDEDGYSPGTKKKYLSDVEKPLKNK